MTQNISKSTQKIHPVFDTLDGNRLPKLNEIAKLIKSGSVKNIIIMAGAGISTRAGIPDFRSPETGLYANLEKFKLPYPEAIFDIDYFRRNPIPFYTLAKEMNPRKYKPTKTHEFFKLLEMKKLLKRCFTQNIDTLERSTSLSDHLIVEAHGSFATCHCLECHGEVTDEEFMRRLHQDPPQLVRCLEKSCVGNPAALIKPDIVFFGEQLPTKFYESLNDFSKADLLIVLGTSLKVEPFASLITKVPINCPRLLINLETVGEIDEDNLGGFDFEGIQRGGKEMIRDVLFLGTTDDGIEELCDLLGWKNDLLELYEGNQKTRKLKSHEDIDKDVEKLLDAKNKLNEQMSEYKKITTLQEKMKESDELETPQDVDDSGKDENKLDQLTSTIKDLSL